MAAVSVRDHTISAAVVEHARIASGEEVLDVGCGTGTLAAPRRSALYSQP
ncbi:MAG: hypothetical protein M3400_07155 [Actinomycetota bacterium]|nr:hypothetical protein [Actinomycetota bacterium]